jgi:hydroxymethylpyrimidine/phosphomethylpyrimidine kinase
MEEVFRKVFPLKRGMVLDVGYSEEEIDVLKAVQKIMDFIGGNSSYSELVPEVRTNIAVSKKDAKNLNQIAGVEGRITLVNGLPVASGPIKFGATNHTGRLLLEAKKYDNDINVVINIKYKPEIILKLADTNFCMIDIDRLKQSSDGTKKEDTTWVG